MLTAGKKFISDGVNNVDIRGERLNIKVWRTHSSQ